MSRKISTGAAIVVVLHSPREKCWGILDEINTAGVFLRGLDLNSFDDWLGALLHNEPFVGPSDLFFPTWRIERISRDETAGAVPSLCEQVEKRTGKRIKDLFTVDATRLM